MIKSFTSDEKKMLIAAAKFIMSADGMITGSEITSINTLAEEKGFDDFQDVFDDVDRDIKSMDDIINLINKLKGSSNCREIIRYALEISRADANINHEEIEIIQIMGKEWGIDLKTLINE